MRPIGHSDDGCTQFDLTSLIEESADFGGYSVYGNGAPGTIRTSDPQIRSLVSTVEIASVCYRKKQPKAL